MGQIAAAAGQKRMVESPLTVEIEQFVKMTAFVATATGLIFFTLGMLFVDDDFLTQFVFFVGKHAEHRVATQKLYRSTRDRRVWCIFQPSSSLEQVMLDASRAHRVHEDYLLCLFQ